MNLLPFDKVIPKGKRSVCVVTIEKRTVRVKRKNIMSTTKKIEGISDGFGRDPHRVYVRQHASSHFPDLSGQSLMTGR